MRELFCESKVWGRQSSVNFGMELQGCVACGLYQQIPLFERMSCFKPEFGRKIWGSHSWRYRLPEVWCCVTGWVAPYIARDRFVSIFKSQGTQEEWTAEGRGSLTDHEEEGSTHPTKQHHILSLNLPECKMSQHKTGTYFSITFARLTLAKKE